MDPANEIPRVFDTWQMHVRQAGICDSLADLDFLEVHAFGAAPKEPHPLANPEGYVATPMGPGLGCELDMAALERYGQGHELIS